ncbi:hypothetical protein PL81_38510 [Streptomyces sp. RSD-27]|nr:hypothetical protein PL81_38510 [Streptomyces sp. RSD-27]
MADRWWIRPAADRARWALRADRARQELAHQLHGTVEPGGAVETRRARVIVAAPVARPHLLRVTVQRYDRTGPTVTAEVDMDRIDIRALAAVVRAASRTPWRARIRARLPFLPTRKQKTQ